VEINELKHEFGVIKRGGKGVHYSRSRGKNIIVRRIVNVGLAREPESLGI